MDVVSVKCPCRTSSRLSGVADILGLCLNFLKMYFIGVGVLRRGLYTPAKQRLHFARKKLSGKPAVDFGEVLCPLQSLISSKTRVYQIYYN
jgi:hypothetical protein